MRVLLVAAAAFVIACGGSHGDVPDAAPPSEDSAMADAPTDAIADAADAMLDASPDAPPDAAPFGDPFEAMKALPGQCSQDHWCWLEPRPTGNKYTKVYGTGADNIWIAAWGTLMQWDGYAWRFHHPPSVPTSLLPLSMSGTSASNMFVIYGTSLEHWDGTTWTVLETLGSNPGFNNVWVAPDSGDAWTTQTNGILKHWHDGAIAQSFTPCNGCFLGSIYGTSSRDIFLTTIPSTILHYDGKEFTRVYTGTQTLGGYQGATNDVWVSGGGGGLARWDGTAFTNVPLPPEIATKWIEPMGYLGPNDIWWFVVFGGGGLVHWDGTSIEFRRTSDALLEQYNGLGSIFSSRIIAGRTWLVGDGGCVFTTSAPWVFEPVIDPDWALTSGLWGSSDHDMYIANGRTLQHWDGTAMMPVPLALADWHLINSVQGVRVGDHDELFVGAVERNPGQTFTGVMLHFDGATWTRQMIGTGADLYTVPSLSRMVVLGPGEALGVGSQGVAMRYANGHWDPIASNTAELLTGVYAPDADHAFVSGTHGTLLQWDRSDPGVLRPDERVVTSQDLGPIHGVAGRTYVASAATSSIWVNDGTGWTEQPATTTGSSGGGLFAVSPTEIVAATGSFFMSRFNGTTWVEEDLAATTGAPHLAKPPGGHMWAAGNRGIFVHP